MTIKKRVFPALRSRNSDSHLRPASSHSTPLTQLICFLTRLFATSLRPRLSRLMWPHGPGEVTRCKGFGLGGLLCVLASREPLIPLKFLLQFTKVCIQLCGACFVTSFYLLPPPAKRMFLNFSISNVRCFQALTEQVDLFGRGRGGLFHGSFSLCSVS